MDMAPAGENVMITRCHDLDLDQIDKNAKVDGWWWSMIIKMIKWSRDGGVVLAEPDSTSSQLPRWIQLPTDLCQEQDQI